jgi:hypothetical protein
MAAIDDANQGESRMKTIAPTLALLLACTPALAQTSPYAGQEARPIKALRDDDQS